MHRQRRVDGRIALQENDTKRLKVPSGWDVAGCKWLDDRLFRYLPYSFGTTMFNIVFK